MSIYWKGALPKPGGHIHPQGGAVMGQFLTMFGVLSMVVQVATELVQRLGLKKWTQVVAGIAGVAVAVTTRTGLLAHFGIGVNPAWADWLFMGLALSGGGWALDLLKKMGQTKVSG